MSIIIIIPTKWFNIKKYPKECTHAAHSMEGSNLNSAEHSALMYKFYVALHTPRMFSSSIAEEVYSLL